LAASHDVSDLSKWTEVLDILPFDGHEEALWALRIERMRSGTTHTLDLFGLADYDSGDYAEFGLPVAGDLAYVTRGYGSVLIEMLAAADAWWAQFRRSSFRGRPIGTGTWESSERFEEELKRVVSQILSEGGKPTQEHVAERLHTDDRQLRAWCTQFRINWREIKKG
jgi:hypothetical protein